MKRKMPFRFFGIYLPDDFQCLDLGLHQGTLLGLAVSFTFTHITPPYLFGVHAAAEQPFQVATFISLLSNTLFESFLFGYMAGAVASENFFITNPQIEKGPIEWQGPGRNGIEIIHFGKLPCFHSLRKINFGESIRF